MAAKGRIPQSFIDDLLSRLDIVEIIDRRVPLKKSGRNYTARCPFHDEKTPSFSVNPDKQFYYCFGCGAGGNALSFIMDYDRQDFPAAVDTLAHHAGLEVPREELTPQQQRKQQQRKTIYDLMAQLATHYQQQLRQHPQGQRAVDYLKQRGLNGQIARDFGIGFAPPGWDNVLQQFGVDEQARQQLIDAGMVVVREDGRSYDRFRDRIMFPIRDNRGRVVAFGGRVLGDDKPKYLNSPETDIFHKGRELYGLYEARQHNRQLDQLLVVEGYMDVVALAQNGIPRGVATLGTASNTDHLRTAFRYTSEIVFCFDGDQAGRNAAQRALENALPVMEDGRQVRFLFLPEGEDPDSLVRRIGTAGFLQHIAQAMPLEDFLFTSLSEGLNTDSMEGRARLSKLAAPMLAQLPEGVYKQLMLDALAKRTGLTPQALEQLMQSAAPPEDEAPPPGHTGSSDRSEKRRDTAGLMAKLPASRRDPALFALAMLLFAPQRTAKVPLGLSALGKSALGDSDSEVLLRDILQLLERRPDSTTAMLLGHWHGQPQYALLTEALNTIELLGPWLDDERAAAAFSDTLQFFQAQHTEQRYRERLAALKARTSERPELPVSDTVQPEVDKTTTANYAEIDDETKAQLLHIQQLLAEKHRR
ncbi:DNA primase [Spongiibacter nanhainus]|uniref:DNA primase n=1 Tax=Spongiibacter nanhainus TaxID=2794344 RepID=A0A7T4R306_9GAMM|nr:DNA primase [Spongiibacter nanhainus]QQD19382.1 DNA primase [Spongiibacter nanhainus]